MKVMTLFLAQVSLMTVILKGTKPDLECLRHSTDKLQRMRRQAREAGSAKLCSVLWCRRKRQHGCIQRSKQPDQCEMVPASPGQT